MAVDQNQPSAPNNMAGFTQPDLAQSFQPDVPNLRGAEILLRAGQGTEDSVTLSVFDGLPNAGGTLLTRGGTIAREGDWARVLFDPIPVVSGQTYYMVLESGGTGGLGIMGDILNPYPGGQVFANAGFGSFPDFDYTFRTYAEVPVMIDGFETGNTHA